MALLRYSGHTYGTPKGVFMMWFFLAAYLNFFTICAAVRVTYGGSSFTAMKWLGSLIGVIPHSIMIALVILLIDYAPWGGIVLVSYYAILIVFHIIYKKIIEKRTGDFCVDIGRWHR